MEFALMHGSFLMRMKKLDGIFDRENVKGSFLVDFVDDGRERGRLSGASRSGDKRSCCLSPNQCCGTHPRKMLFEPVCF